ncbi:MAG: small ligand-binding sensory domain FIST [Planctomycetota bacterium]|jgi:small ligand-binding sensory domain FIST
MSSPRFASAQSIRHDGTLALREAVEELKEGLAGQTPDLLVLFVSHHHASEFDSLGERLSSLTGAGVLVGCSGESIIGSQSEMEQVPAISLWAVACEDIKLTPFRVGAHPTDGFDSGLEEAVGANPIGYSSYPDLEGASGSLLLFGDPFSFPMTDFLRQLENEAPDLAIAGGMASGGRKLGDNALFLAGQVQHDGAVGVHIDGGIELTSVVSQAYRPVGKPWVITSCEGPLVKKLGGKKASAVMMSTFQDLPEQERELLKSPPMLGIAFDPAQSKFDPSDFLAHPIRGIAPQENAIAIFGEPRRGQTIQFMVRDPQSAGQNFLEQLKRSAGPPPSLPHEAGALLFSCAARGSRMFVEPNHDISRIHSYLGPELPVAGFFAQGEIGRIGGKNRLHGFAASTAIFRAKPDNS